MPLSPFLNSICNQLELGLRPSLEQFIKKEYKARNNRQPPSDNRLDDLVAKSLDQMRRAIEEAYDKQMSAGHAKDFAFKRMHRWLEAELDREFQKVIVAES
jgi:hypothetical protein